MNMPNVAYRRTSLAKALTAHHPWSCPIKALCLCNPSFCRVQKKPRSTLLWLLPVGRHDVTRAEGLAWACYIKIAAKRWLKCSTACKILIGYSPIGNFQPRHDSRHAGVFFCGMRILVLGLLGLVLGQRRSSLLHANQVIGHLDLQVGNG